MASQRPGVIEARAAGLSLSPIDDPTDDRLIANAAVRAAAALVPPNVPRPTTTTLRATSDGMPARSRGPARQANLAKQPPVVGTPYARTYARHDGCFDDIVPGRCARDVVRWEPDDERTSRRALALELRLRV